MEKGEFQHALSHSKPLPIGLSRFAENVAPPRQAGSPFVGFPMKDLPVKMPRHHSRDGVALSSGAGMPPGNWSGNGPVASIQTELQPEFGKIDAQTKKPGRWRVNESERVSVLMYRSKRRL
jgi:hypothetical protein